MTLIMSYKTDPVDTCILSIIHHTDPIDTCILNIIHDYHTFGVLFTKHSYIQIQIISFLILQCSFWPLSGIILSQKWFFTFEINGYHSYHDGYSRRYSPCIYILYVWYIQCGTVSTHIFSDFILLLGSLLFYNLSQKQVYHNIYIIHNLWLCIL